jgi:hypothetical protein
MFGGPLKLLRWIVCAGCLAFSFSAHAEEPTTEDEFEPPPPPVVLERIPPRFSYELGVAISVASMRQFVDFVGVSPWPGFAVRAGWGRNLGANRIGFGGGLGIEGPAPQFYSGTVEVFAAWDHITPSGFAIGASSGPELMLHNHLKRLGTDRWVEATPTLAARIGWSQTWSRVGRRVHTYIEPKGRILAGAPTWAVSLVVGSGRGR